MAPRILVATDGSEPSRRTSNLAARLSKALSLEVDLAVAMDLHRVEYKMLAEMYVDMIRKGARDAANETLQEEVEYLRSQGISVRPRILEGQPGPAICEAAGEGDYALVVVGRKGKGGDIQDILFGSVSNWVVHNCRKPVLVAKMAGPLAAAARTKRPVRILAGVDGSPWAQRTLEFLGAIGSPEGLELTLLNVVDPEKTNLEHLPGELRYKALEALHQDAMALLERCARPLREAGFPVSTRVEEGSPANTICRVYREDDFEISVMGHRGLSELGDALLGSVSNSVLHHCPGHVLMVP